MRINETCAGVDPKQRTRAFEEQLQEHSKKTSTHDNSQSTPTKSCTSPHMQGTEAPECHVQIMQHREVLHFLIKWRGERKRIQEPKMQESPLKR